MTSSQTQDNLPEIVGKVVGEIIYRFGFLCLRAWLLSICAAWIFPGFALGFWQWVLIAITIRMLICPTNKTDK